jgi:hypothetical protein
VELVLHSRFMERLHTSLVVAVAGTELLLRVDLVVEELTHQVMLTEVQVPPILAVVVLAEVIIHLALKLAVLAAQELSLFDMRNREI